MSSGDRLIQDYVAGRYCSIDTGQPVASPIRRIALEATIEGREAGLLDGLDLGATPITVSDQNTHDVLGGNVARALKTGAVILDHPKADEDTAKELKHKTRHATSLIAVGSGTLNDLAKYVGFQTGRPSVVFATAASMNGYTTKTVSIDRDGVKMSLHAQAPVACIFDLNILAAAPKRLTRAGVGDAICRGTAQIDWLFSHNLLRTAYLETPFDLQIVDERNYLATAARVLNGDLEAIAALTRILILGGLGAVAAGSSHPGSMGEHGISHFIDMYAKPHPGSLHGEQIGITTLTMARLQKRMLAKSGFDALGPLPVDQAGIKMRYGGHAGGYIKTITAKNAKIKAVGDLGQRLNALWPRLNASLSRLSTAPERIEGLLTSIDAVTKPVDIGLDPDFYRQAVRHAFEIRDRYSLLDLAVQTGEIDDFIDEECS